MDNDYELPEEAQNDYMQSPVAGKPLIEQIAYWRDRAKFFEEKAYEALRLIKKIQSEQKPEDIDDADWWRKMDD